jgi:putative hemolysin
MNHKHNWAIGFLFLTGWLVMLLGCTADAAETAVTPAVTPTYTPPTEVVVVRDAVLDFLRDGANICVPPEGVVWHINSGGPQTPAGYEMVRFSTSDNCTVTVTYPQTPGDEPLYHVALGHGVTGFCWQALVDEQGHVVQTGVSANGSEQIGNPAKTYCEAQGYEYETITTAAGMECGQCIFPDGSRCQGWAYLNDMCQPGENPAESE